MRPAEFFRVARTPRMLVLFVLLVSAALVCVRLGAWQFDRAAIRGAEQFETAHSARIAADPVPLEDVLRPGDGFLNEYVAQHVSATGHVEPGTRLVVPGRSVDGQDAVIVVEAFRLTAGPDAGAMIPLARGWLPAADVDLDVERVAAADDPALDAPAGDVTLTGYLGGSEQAVTDPSLPAGAVPAISTGQLTGLWGGPGFSGYLVAEEPGDAGGRLHTLRPPAMAEDTGLNVRNIFYAIEWLVFGGFALALWVRMVKDQVIADREDALLEAAYRERLASEQEAAPLASTQGAESPA